MADEAGRIRLLGTDAAELRDAARVLERAGYRVVLPRGDADPGETFDLVVCFVRASDSIADVLRLDVGPSKVLRLIDGASTLAAAERYGLVAAPRTEGGLVALVRAAMADARSAPNGEDGGRARRLLDRAQVGVFEVEDGRLTYVNDYLVELSKYSRDELLTASLADLVCPQDARRLEEALLARAQGSVADRPSTYRFLAKDGSELEAEVVSRRVETAGGVRVEGTMRDVTAEARLARMHRIVLELGGVILREQDIDRILQLVLDTITEYSGFRRAVLALYDLGVPDPVDGEVTKILCSGLSSDDEATLTEQPSLTPEKRRLAFSEEYRLGAAYYIPHDRAPWAQGLGLTGTVTVAGWHPDDLLFIPLRGTAGIVGTISVDDPLDPSAPTLESIEPIAQLASFAALAVERVVKWSELKTQNERLHGLSRFGNEVAHIQSVGELCEATARRICSDVARDFAAVWLCDGDMLVLEGIASRGNFAHEEVPTRGKRMPIAGEGLTRWAVRYMESAVVDDAVADARYRPSRPSVRSMAAIPILGRKGVRGVLDVESQRLAAFSEQDLVALSSMASQLSVALAALGRREALSRIYALGQRISESTTVSEIVAGTLDFLAEQFGYPLALVFLDGRAGHLSVAGLRGAYAERGIAEGWEIPAGRGIVSWVARNKRFAVVHDVTTDPRYFEVLPGIRSEVAVPLLYAEKLVGVLSVESPQPSFFDDEDRVVLEVIANHLATALANLVSQESLREQTVRDPLTGLFNRHYFNSIIAPELARSDRYARPFTVLMIDVDNFRAVNNRFGHLMGDEVLQEVSRLLLEHVRESDRVIRYGGDEFLIFMPETAEEEASHVASRLREEMALLPRKKGVADIAMGLSIGAYTRRPREKWSLEAILEEADRRLYADKRARHIERADDYRH